MMLATALSHYPLIFVGGKGGVGKTTHAAALAASLADSGHSTLIVSTDPAHSLGDVLNVRLSHRPTQLTATLTAIELNPQTIIDAHFAQIENTIMGYSPPDRLPAIKKHLDAAKFAPGAEEAAMLEAICQQILNAPKQGYQHLIFDTAPTGHTLRLLELPQMMRVWTEGLLAQQYKQRQLGDAANALYAQTERENPNQAGGKYARWQQAIEVLEKRANLFHQAGHKLTNPNHTTIVPVMTAENLPLAETRRLLAQLKQFHLPCKHLIINQLIPQAQADNPFWQQRYARQTEILQTIATEFTTQTHHHYPLQASDIRGIAALMAFGNTRF